MGGFEQHDDQANHVVAAELASLKQGGALTIHGDSQFTNQALYTAAQCSRSQDDFRYQLADTDLRRRYEEMQRSVAAPDPNRTDAWVQIDEYDVDKNGDVYRPGRSPS